MENSPSTTQNSLAKFCLFPERALLFHNNSPATLHCSPATTIFNENPACIKVWFDGLVILQSWTKPVETNSNFELYNTHNT